MKKEDTKNKPIAEKNRNGLWVHLPEKTVYGPRRRTQISFDPKEGRTKQEFKDEANLANIVKRFHASGNDPNVLARHIRTDGKYGDFTTVPQFQEAMNVVVKAKEQFDMLPSNIRERFDNNPEKFLAFVHDKENAEEMVKLGIAKKIEPTKPSDADRIVDAIEKLKEQEHPMYDEKPSIKPPKGSGSTKT